MPKDFPTPLEQQTQPHWELLNEIIDPEVGIGIVDMGLVYSVEIDKEGTANVKMTFTSPSCPAGPMLVHQVEDTMLTQVEGVKKAYVQVVWEPMWNQEMINPDVKDLMFGF